MSEFRLAEKRADEPRRLRLVLVDSAVLYEAAVLQFCDCLP